MNTSDNTFETKSLLVKVIALDKMLKDYQNNIDVKVIENKFLTCFGGIIAYHILNNYTTAEELIWSLDDNNLDKFIHNFNK